MVTIDALGSDRSFILGIKDALKERFGLKHEEVLINFSHTHGCHTTAMGSDNVQAFTTIPFAQDE